MDFATLIGLISGTIIIAFAMLSGSDISAFINIPGLLIVLGGTFAATLIKFPIGICFSSFGLALRKAFWQEPERPRDIIKLANQLATLVRKENLMALERENIANPFFKKGIQLCIDGRKADFIRDVLTREMNLSLERHQFGEKIFRAMGESAPAFGMIGTLVGLVQMLSSLKDAAAIGPAMAVALLTTLYGALIANLIALPIADKLNGHYLQERINKSLILESVLGILEGENPRVLSDLLESYLPTNQRLDILPTKVKTSAATAGANNKDPASG